jgi:TatD DNase family protein
MIDSHCHLTDRRFANQLPAVLDRAAAAGVRRMVTIGTKPTDWEPAIALARTFPNVRCAVGVHPNHCHEVEIDQMDTLRALQADPGILAVGETGLDYHYDYAPRARQAEFFQAHLELAAELNKSVVIHCREAVDDCLAILRNGPKVPAVFHCFTGTPDEAEKILNAGYLLGFTGVLTFKNADPLRQAAKAAPADRIMVETDAPYLSPEPKRKEKVNEPAWVMHTAAMLATVRGVDIGEIDRVTTANANRFYGWPG